MYDKHSVVVFKVTLLKPMQPFDQSSEHALTAELKAALRLLAGKFVQVACNALLKQLERLLLANRRQIAQDCLETAVIANGGQDLYQSCSSLRII